MENTKDQARSRENIELFARVVKNALNIIEQPRERTVIVERFGLDGNKLTLEGVGKSLNITRERVRQLEKAILVRLRVHAEDGKIADLATAEKLIVRNLSEMGRVAKLSEVSDKIFGDQKTTLLENQLVFIASISKHLTYVENDGLNYFAGIAISECGDSDEIHAKVKQIVDLVVKKGEPISLDKLDKVLDYEHPSQISAMASLSKRLAEKDNLIGLKRWSSVNPRTIRDRVYEIVTDPAYGQKPTHFAELARILNEKYPKHPVSVQAVHNELIKDKRFVIVGRGTYALTDWGYETGTLIELIQREMKKQGHPLTREEVVRAVLKNRLIKETTILLALQKRKYFKKIDKNTYYLADEK